MVEKLRAILTLLEKKMGPTYLFAILKMDELTDRWSLLVSGPWAAEASKRQTGFDEVIKLMRERLSANELDSISRVGVFSMEEHLVQDMLTYKKDSHITESVRANGNIIHEAWIIESKAAHINKDT